MLPTLADLRISDLVDIAIVAVLLWVAVAWFQTSRARMAILGLSLIGALFLVAHGLSLQLTTWLLQGFFAVAAVMLIVVFQDDLRRLFEGIAIWGLRRGAPRPPPDVERVLVRLCVRLAKAKIGALVVLPGREPLERHLEGGVHLDGRLSEQLLLSLFDPGSPGHDGAVIVRANKVVRFGVHLPLSTDWDRLGPGGTRHAAALGLAERSDALCLVVSEERGTVSIAHAGEIQRVGSPDALANALRGFIERFVRDTAPGGFGGLLSRIGSRWREGMLAIGLAAGLWYVAVPGAAVETVRRVVPISVDNLPDGYRLIGVDPAEVEVRFLGRRRDLYLASAGQLGVRVDGLLAQLGRRTFELSLEQVESPEGLQAVAINPPKVKISIERP